MKQKFYFSDDIEYWFTANGNHIPVRSGQTREEAFDAFLKLHGDPRGKSTAELRRELAVDQSRLTADEWRIWHESCERIARGFKGIAPKIDGLYCISVGNRKIVMTSGKYPDFRIQQISVFDTESEQERFLNFAWKKT